MKKRFLTISILLTSTLLFANTYSRTNNIVTDHDTDLQWQDTPYSDVDKNTYNSETKESIRARQWIHAKAYCDNLNLDGGGWRLPVITELDAIVDKNQRNPALDPIFQNALGLGTWSGTTYQNTSQAWGMGFYEGNRHHCTKNNKSKLIMCVRENSGTPPPSNKAPVAKAGADQTVINGNIVTLDGSSSNDSDGTISAYSWKEGNTYLSNKESFDKSNFSIGTHTITLTVTDDDGATNSDNVMVTITSINTLPTVDAGPDKIIQVNETVSISGTGIDTDGTIEAYTWKKGNMILATTASFVYIPDTIGTDTLTLTVTDNDGATGTDTMNVVVSATPPPADTTPPVITLNGTDPMNINQGSTFIDPGVTAEDAIDGTITVTVSGTVDTSTVESYILTYTAEDSAGNMATKTRTVNVIAKPTILPDWINVADDGNIYTATSGSIVTSSGNFDDVEINEDKITLKTDCLAIEMKSNGNIITGFQSGCSAKVGLTVNDTFASGTKVSVQSDGSIIIDTPLINDLVLGDK